MKIFGVLLAVCAALSGVAIAQSATGLAGMEAYNERDYANAYRLLREASDAGDAEAEANLGYLYARGQGVAADQQEALRLYARAADQGDGEGMNGIGYKYLFGTGVAVDRGLAVHWFCLAVAKGNPRAMDNLGLMLRVGRYLSRDVPEARSLWKQAADRGNTNAMLNLSSSYSNPPDMDPVASAQWLLRAAQGGQPLAIAMLRERGYSGPLPMPFDQAVSMIESAHFAPGHTKACGPIA
jgi:TPR repeat protein